MAASNSADVDNPSNQRLGTKGGLVSSHPFSVLQISSWMSLLLLLLLTRLGAKKPSSRPDVGITFQMPKSL